MKANRNCLLNDRGLIRRAGAAVLLLLLGLPVAWAQTITSDPADGATGVSVSAPVIFTFSSAVDPTQTTPTFYSTSPPGSYTVTTTWSAGNTVLTCTPTSPFPNNATINWVVLVNVTPIPVVAQGTFSTGSGGGGGGGGSGTNAITTLSIGKLYLYQQTNSAAPTSPTNFGYAFFATVGLASNRTATAVTVTIPGASSATALNQSFSAHEDYTFEDFNRASSSAFEAAYPQGNYVYNVTGTPSNLQVTVSMPSTMLQPNAPHISNFSNAQSVNAAQAFTVTWDPFQGGSAADYIGLSVTGDSGEVFRTPDPGTKGVLAGTALSATIPPNTLGAGSNYTAELVFYRFQAVSNATYATTGYRASGTEFNLTTSGGSSSAPPVVSNPVVSGSSFGFDVATSVNQALTVLYSTNCTQPLIEWQPILATNSPGASVHITVSAQAAATGFFRVQNGP